MAFALGLVLASALFWYFSGEDETPLVASPAASQDAQLQSPGPPGQPGKSAPQATARRSAEPPKQTSAKRPPAAGQEQPDQDEARKQAEEAREAERRSAVASALHDLHDMQNFPFEEALSPHLDERIRQVDYALMQASWLQQLPARTVRLSSSEDRQQSGEHYRYQIIDILPGPGAASFISSFRDCLAIWTEGTSLRESAKQTAAEQWTVSVNGLPTHLLRLYPGSTAFPPLPGDTPRPDPGTSRGIGRQRMRAPGEEPKLVIVMDDLGASAAATGSLLNLSFPVTFAFWPHGAHTKEGARAAHARGREVIVHQPMEPLGYPKVKPGPNVLLSGMSEGEIRRIVQAALAAVPHATGLNNHMGSRFTQHAAGVDAVIRVLKERGLFFLDSLTHSQSVFAREGGRLGVAHYRRNVFLDVTPTRSKILEELHRAERIALLTGQAVAIGHPLPETLAALREWETLRNKQVRIVRLRDLRQE